MKSLALYYKLHDNWIKQQPSQGQTSFYYSDYQIINPVNNRSLPDVCEVHTNIWKVYESTFHLSPVYYFDLGLLVSFKCKSVKVFLPFLIQESDNYDLCSVMMKHTDLLCAIFNDNMLPKAQVNSCFTKVENQTTSSEFYLYRINNNNLEIETYRNNDKEEGTFLKVDFLGVPENDNISAYEHSSLYIRLRFRIKNANDFCISECISNDLIQAAFSKTSLFDLRFNETREIDGKVLEKMTKDGYSPFRFNKLHVFFIADTREKVENGSSLKIDSRLLEKDHWQTYEPKSVLHNVHYIAHHWRRRCKENEEPFRDFSVFFSSIYPDIGILKLVTYFVVVVLLGWFGSMLSFPVSDLFELNLHLISLVKAILVIVACFGIIALLFYENFEIVWIKIFRKR